MTARPAIVGLGFYVPPTLVQNDDIHRFFNLPEDLTVDFMENRIKIKTRYTARKTHWLDDPAFDPKSVSEEEWGRLWGTAEGSENSTMSSNAIKKALEFADMKATELDMVIHCSCTPDFPIPPTSTIIQDNLGLKQGSTMDIRSACCGTMQGMEAAYAMIKAGLRKTVAVVGCDVGSVFGNLNQDDKHYDKGDGVNAVLIGDAAAAVIVSDVESGDPRWHYEILDTVCQCQSDGKPPGMWMPGGGSVNPASPGTVEKGLHNFQHDYKRVIKTGPALYLNCVQHILDNNGLTLPELDHIVPHQANGRVADIGASLGVPPEKVFMNFEKYGNTANASCFLALTECSEKVQDQDLVLVVSAESTKWLYGGFLLRAHTGTPRDVAKSDVSLLAKWMSTLRLRGLSYAVGALTPLTNAYSFVTSIFAPGRVQAKQ